MKKGFTLIELLAVIVILAVIALIATPIIINIINDSREQAGIRGAELYIDAAKLAIVKANMTGEVNVNSCTILQTGNLNCGGTEVQVDMNGTTATAGTITFTNGKITSVTGLVMGDATYGTDSNGKIVKGDAIAHVPFTGTIYRISSEKIMPGQSITQGTEPVVCIHMYVNNELVDNSCNYNIYFDTMEECTEGVATYEEPGATFTCEAGVRHGLTDYQTESPLTMPFTKNAYCLVNSDNNYNSCAADNFGFMMQEACNELASRSNNFTCEIGVIRPNYYLKHEVENDIIQSSYSCIKYVDGVVAKELCLQGGDQSYYGEYDGMSSQEVYDIRNSNPTGNLAILASEIDYFDNAQSAQHGCSFRYYRSECSDGDSKISTSSNGPVEARKEIEYLNYTIFSYCGVDSPLNEAYCN